MALDYNKYNYVPFNGIPNLLYPVPLTTPDAAPPYIATKGNTFIFEAAKKFPNFKFVLIYQSTCRFEVYHGMELLGTVGNVTDRYGDAQVFLSNDRIRNTLVRGNSIKTKDIKKALRLVAKHFKARTQREMVDDATSLLRDNINANASAFHNTFHTTRARVLLSLTKYVVDNFAELREVALCAGAKPEALDNFLSQHDEFELSSAIHDAFTNKRGYSVVLKDSDYIVTRLVDCDTVILKSDVLPSGIKQKVGMLKLVADKSFARDIGYRMDSNTFFVLEDT